MKKKKAKSYELSHFEYGDLGCAFHEYEEAHNNIVNCSACGGEAVVLQNPVSYTYLAKCSKCGRWLNPVGREVVAIKLWNVLNGKPKEVVIAKGGQEFELTRNSYAEFFEGFVADAPIEQGGMKR